MTRKLTDSVLHEVKEEMRAIMIATAQARATITYAEVARMLQTARVHYHSFLFARLLNEIGTAEVQAGRGVLPAVVVTKQTGIPGGGYFRIAGTDYVPGDPNALEQMWRDDLEAVFAYWAEHDE